MWEHNSHLGDAAATEMGVRADGNAPGRGFAAARKRCRPDCADWLARNVRLTLVTEGGGHQMFEDRRDAGRRLAARLARYRSDDLVVLGVLTGGMVVAGEVARALHAPLDVVVVRKLRAPGAPGPPIGAIAGAAIPEVVLDQDVITTLAVSADYVHDELRTRLGEVRLREALLREGRRALPLGDRTVILVDDAVVTGVTLRASLGAVRRGGPRRLVLAVPFAPVGVTLALRALADRVVCLSTPQRFDGVRAFYRDFEGVADGHVVTLLAEARLGHGVPGAVTS